MTKQYRSGLWLCILWCLFDCSILLSCLEFFLFLLVFANVGMFVFGLFLACQMEGPTGLLETGTWGVVCLRIPKILFSFSKCVVVRTHRSEHWSLIWFLGVFAKWHLEVLGCWGSLEKGKIKYGCGKISLLAKNAFGYFVWATSSLSCICNSLGKCWRPHRGCGLPLKNQVKFGYGGAFF